MNGDRIREIQSKTAYPDSISVQQALLQVWNECQQENAELRKLIKEQEEVSCKIWVKIPEMIERFNSHGEDYKSAIKGLLSEFYLFEAAAWVRNIKEEK